MRFLSAIMVVFVFISSLAFYPNEGSRKHKIIWGIIALTITALFALLSFLAIREDDRLQMQVIDESKTFVGIEIDANGSRFIFE